MLYVDYNFMIDELGLRMTDTHPDEILKIEGTPFKIGDIFVLTQDASGAMFFRKTQDKKWTIRGSDGVKQLNLF